MLAVDQLTANGERTPLGELPPDNELWDGHAAARFLERSQDGGGSRR
jgi:hypothetical protein